MKFITPWIVYDNAGARAGMSAVIVSSVLERTAGIETIPHLTTRDYTVMGLEAVLFGAHAEGVRNILAVTGDPPEVGDYPGSRGVYEIDAIGLVELMARLNKGEDYNGRPIDAPTSFLIGVAVNPTADDLDVELDRYHRKIEAGAHFAMTQLVFDLKHLDRFFERFGGPSPIPVLVGICPIWSYRFALRLNNELPGIGCAGGRDGVRKGAVRRRSRGGRRRLPRGAVSPAAQRARADQLAQGPVETGAPRTASSSRRTTAAGTP